MASLITSAEELLKTRTIPQLRELVYSLENDGNSKITELQVMVGSKYHDFIQSADAIAAMQQKSEFLEVNLEGFLKLSQDVVSKTSDLLSRTLQDKATDSKLIVPLKLYKAVDSHDVWRHLEDCDIFSAAKTVAQSKIFLEAYNISRLSGRQSRENGENGENNRGNGENKSICPLPFCRFFSQDAMRSLTQGLEVGVRTPQVVTGCSSAVFLSQTVLDDARLLLLEGSCSFHEKARTLASVGLLSEENNGESMHRGNLLLMYLEGADVLLDAAIDGLGERLLTEPQTVKSKSAPAVKPPPSNAATGEKLVQAVQMLQQTILDVHLLFFKPQIPSSPTTSTPHSSSTTSNTSNMGSATVPGLVILKQLEFISDIDRLITPLLSSTPPLPSTSIPSILCPILSLISPNSLNPLLPSTGEKKGLQFDYTAFLNFDKTKAPPVEIKKIFDQWVGRAVHRVGERARAALEAMNSATEVARLQQRVWLCCTTVTTSTSGIDTAASTSSTSLATPLSSSSALPSASFSSPSTSLSSFSVYSQSDWEESCLELLALKKRRTQADSSAAAASLLWSRVFRLPFMLQVERLLRESCMGVLRGAKGLLLQSLALEGVAVDPVTLTASLMVSANGRTSSSSSGGSGVGGVGGVGCYATLCAPSPRIFRRAEAVRCLLQEELSDLLRDIIVPVQEGDPESSTGLNRALFIQCSQLSGHIAILLRSLCASFTTAIDANVKAYQVAMKAGQIHGQNIGLSSNAPLLSGLLLVGRLSWLLKIRGRFLEESLVPAPTTPSSSDSGAASVIYDLVSEDQMRSAFEIADTNGDGVLTYTEAIEAVHALAVNDTDNFSSPSNGSNGSSPSGGSIPFLSPRLSPTLNFNEFSLLCAHFMSAASCSPVERLKSCFNETISTAHTQWAKRVVAVYSPTFISSLTAELGSNESVTIRADADSTATLVTTALSQSRVAPFRSTWRQVWVELDPYADSPQDPAEAQRNGQGNREQVSLPTSVCTSLSAFLFSISHSAACSLLSVDTVQQLPPSDLFSPSLINENDGDEVIETVSRIAHYASTSLYTTALVTAVDAYSSLLKEASLSSEKEFSGEDVALQVMFDLTTLESLGGRCGISESRVLKDCMAGWRARLDPINAEILIPLLVVASEQFTLKTHLLLPALKHPEGTVLPPTTPSSSSLDAIKSNASAISGLFPPAAASRFSLLPLPMSTHFQGSSWVDRDRERDRGAQAIETNDQSAYTGFAAKSILSGLSLSQQQQNHAEQLGKSLISTWGTFLGQNQ